MAQQDLEEDAGGEEGMDSDSPEEMRGHGSSGGKPGLKKLLLFVVLPLILVVGIAAGAYFSGALDPVLAMLGGGGGGSEHGDAKEGDHGGALESAVFYDLPEMLVNLNAAGKKQNFLKIRVALELDSAKDVPHIEQVMPRIIDNFQVYLRELRVEDLQGSAGLYRLREELLARVKTAARPSRVNDVLFKEMLVQ